MQTVKDENGQIHEFPDDATPQEMNDALSQQSIGMPTSNSSLNDRDKFKKYLENLIGMNSSPIQDIGVGLLRGGQNLAAALGEGGQYIASKLTGGYAPQVNIREELGLGKNNPIDPQNLIGPKNPNALVQNIAQYVPALMTGRGISLGEAGNAISKIPYVGNFAKNVLSLGTKPAAFMATQNENPLKGALEGYAGQGIAELSPYAIPAVKSAINNIKTIPGKVKDIFSPGQYADSITKELGSGSKTVDESSKQLSKQLKNAYDSRVAQSGAFFDYPLQQAGNELLYKKPDPLITTAMDEAKPLISAMKDLKIGDLYENFKSNPTFNNGHLLQSELGSMIRRLEKNPAPSTADTAEIKNIYSIRERLKSDINKFLEKRDLNSNENLAPAYKRGSDLYYEHVTPYLSDPKLRQVVKEGRTIVKNIHKPFDTPYNVIDKESGKEKIGSINKIMQDLPRESKNHILFNAIGGKNESPNALLRSLNNVKNKGFGEYFSPELEEAMNALNIRIKNKNRLVTGAKIGGGIAGLGAISGLAQNALSRL